MASVEKSDGWLIHAYKFAYGPNLLRWAKLAKLFANSEDPDQMPHSAASDLCLYSLPITLLGVSRLKWVKVYKWPYLSLKW